VDQGKSCDTFGPIGPWLVTKDEVKDPQDIKMWLTVNGKTMQNGSTKTMVYGVAYLVSYLSQFMSLHPGDIISTGTPPGVGLGMKPPMFLKAAMWWSWASRAWASRSRRSRRTCKARHPRRFAPPLIWLPPSSPRERGEGALAHCFANHHRLQVRRRVCGQLLSPRKRGEMPAGQ